MVTYEKPEVVQLARAIDAVQSVSKGIVDYDGEPSDPTYQADE